MILTVDIGNTNSCFALFNPAGEALAQWRLSTNRMRTADEFTLWVESFLRRNQIESKQISQSVVATVVPSCRYAIISALEALFDQSPLLITSELMAKRGLQVKTDRPSEVGADRLINAFAAHKMGMSPAIIIDFGTATTFDIANEKGDYVGGVIAPGINLSLEALHQAAAKLPSVEIKRPLSVIGKTTETAMQSGLYYGYLGLIERITAEIKQELPDLQLNVIATGGLAPLFAKNSQAIDCIEADLTIRGLFHVAQEIN